LTLPWTDLNDGCRSPGSHFSAAIHLLPAGRIAYDCLYGWLAYSAMSAVQLIVRLAHPNSRKVWKALVEAIGARFFPLLRDLFVSRESFSIDRGGCAAADYLS
jgi:hypothetical protein